MGRAFAAKVEERGHEVIRWNRGPVPGYDPVGIEVVAPAEVVVVMVLDGAASEEVLRGVGRHARPGTVVVNAATVGPDESRRLAAGAAEAGLRYVEAPVLGSVPAVRAGSLTVLAGGAADDVAAAEPVLRCWSYDGSIRRTGPIGTATAAKLVANLGLAVVTAGLHDAVRLGEDLGLRRELVLDVLAGGAFARLVTGKRARLDGGDYGGADFTVGALRKDVELALRGAARPLVLAEAVRQVLTTEDDAGADIAVLGKASPGRVEGLTA